MGPSNPTIARLVRLSNKESLGSNQHLILASLLKLHPETEATIHIQIRAGHKASPGAAQPDNGIGNLLSLRHASHDVFIHLRLEELGAVPLHGVPDPTGHVRVPGADGVGPHALGGQGVRQLGRVVRQGGLHGAVGRGGREVDLAARHGPDGDDGPPGRLEVRERRLDQVEGAHHVNIKGGLPGLGRVRDRQRRHVGYHHVDLARGCVRRRHPARQLRRVADVHRGAHGLGVREVGRQLGGGRLDVGRCAGAEVDSRAFRQEASDYGKAYRFGAPCELLV
jgi:hypothetical protein